MSLNRRIAFGVAASWLNRLVLLGINLIVIPLLFRRLGQEELGLWFLLGQSGAFLGLMDFGVSPTLTRRIALAKGKSGGAADVALSQESQLEIANLLASGRRVYNYLALGVFALAWLSGVFFLGSLSLTHVDPERLWIAWSIMALSHAATVWASLYTCLLDGLGFVGRDAIINAAVGVVALAGRVVVVVLGGGLVSLAVVATLGALTTRFFLARFARRQQGDLFQVRGHWNPTLIRSMVNPALRAWVTALSAFLILQTGQYFIAYYQGAAQIPPYSALYQLVANLNMLAVTVSVASGVFVSQLWQAGELDLIHGLIRRNLRLGLAIMLCGSAFLLVVAESLTRLWLGEGQFVGYPVLIIFVAMLTLETQHVIVAFGSRATEDEAFVPVAIASSLLNLLLVWLLIQRVGLLGVALGTFLAQLCTSNWYVVYRGLRRLRMSLVAHVQQVVVPLAFVFVSTLSTTWLAVRYAVPNESDLGRVLVGALVAGSALALTLWFLVLSPQERQRLLTSSMLSHFRSGWG